jgi:hypothetical protein
MGTTQVNMHEAKSRLSELGELGKKAKKVVIAGPAPGPVAAPGARQRVGPAGRKDPHGARLRRHRTNWS